MEEFDFVDFLSALKRRKKFFLIVLCAGLILSSFLALRWSNYRSVATVEVALPEVLVSEGSSRRERETFADTRISYLRQKVLSTGSLVEIITKYDLYPRLRQQRPVADVAESMRRSVRIDLLSGSIANPSSVQKMSVGQLSAIAFNVGFDYESPAAAQRVTSEIVNRFLDEDIKMRRTQAKETTAFLESQLKVLEKSLSEQESRIAAFRAKYGDVRPESLAFNQQAVTSMLLNLQNLESQIAANIGTQGALRAQLASIDPYARITSDGGPVTTPSIQLRALRSDYATLTAKYGPAHPDVLNITRQIQAMEDQMGLRGAASTGQLRGLLNDAQAKYTRLKASQGEKHPDVLALKKKIEGYKAQLAKAPTDDLAGVQDDADNPAYLQVVARLRAGETQARALEAQKKSLIAEIEKRQQAVADNPDVEKQLAALTRDYDNAQTRYRELKAQKLNSEMVEAIEQDRVGQRLVIINPPELPTETSPSRALFLVGGFFLSFMVAFSLIVARQLLYPTVTGARHLESLVGVAPLVVVPHLEHHTPHHVALRRYKWRFLVLAAVVLIAMVLFHMIVMPLDVLVSMVMLKLGFV
ncbi:MAG: hypothetical protein FWF24_07090 [Alphaproteobacteria bacterium]|nr:hypothetical protein [Alphaproteobacteria bacterium]